MEILGAFLTFIALAWALFVFIWMIVMITRMREIRDLLERNNQLLGRVFESAKPPLAAQGESDAVGEGVGMTDSDTERIEEEEFKGPKLPDVPWAVVFAVGLILAFILFALMFYEP